MRLIDIAIKNLMRRRAKAGFVMAGLVVGVAAMVAVIGFVRTMTAEINHRASVRLAELSKEAGVERFIFSSSCSNYGAAGDDFIDEQGAFNPVTPYGVSKVMVERDVSKLADDRFTPVFLRNATAYGVSPRLRFDLVMNNLVAWAFTTGQVYLKSDGSPFR